jgi:hypothetical protein
MVELGLGGCLADDMGLGKTIQVIALHLHRRRGPLLVVCPASLLGNWQRELARFAPDVPVRRYHGGGRHLDDVAADEAVLVTYGVVRRDRAALAGIGWDLVVADEAQHVKNPLSRSARELREVPATARLALTGTPVENRLSDLWSILDWTTPGLLGTLDGFHQRVAVPVERYGDVAVRDRLARVVRPFLLRRRKSDPDVAPELPPKTETDRIVPLTPEQATLYEAVVREALEEIRHAEGMARRGLVLKLLTATPPGTARRSAATSARASARWCSHTHLPTPRHLNGRSWRTSSRTPVSGPSSVSSSGSTICSTAGAAFSGHDVPPRTSPPQPRRSCLWPNADAREGPDLDFVRALVGYLVERDV